MLDLVCTNCGKPLCKEIKSVYVREYEGHYKVQTEEDLEIYCISCWDHPRFTHIQKR